MTVRCLSDRQSLSNLRDIKHLNKRSVILLLIRKLVILKTLKNNTFLAVYNYFRFYHSFKTISTTTRRIYISKNHIISFQRKHS